jgi:hypothetical protein
LEVCRKRRVGRLGVTGVVPYASKGRDRTGRCCVPCSGPVEPAGLQGKPEDMLSSLGWQHASSRSVPGARDCMAGDGWGVLEVMRWIPVILGILYFACLAMMVAGVRGSVQLPYGNIVLPIFRNQ